MKFLWRLLKGLIVFIVILVVVLVLGRNILIPVGAKIAVSHMTNLTLKIEKFNMGILDTSLDIQGLKIFNPDGYQDPVMLDLPRLYVDYNLKDIIGGKIHFAEVKLVLAEFLLVKQADGSSNLDGIMRLADKNSREFKKEEEAKEPEAEKKVPEIQLDVFELKIGKFVSKEYSKSGKADTKEIKIDIDKRYENQSISAIASDISKYVFKVLLQMTMNLNLGDAGDFLTGTIGTVGDIGIGTAKKGMDVGKGILDEAGGVLKNTTNGVKNIIKLPFGK